MVKKTWFGRLSWRNKLALVAIPILLSALVVGYVLAQQEVLLQSSAAGGTVCKERCRDTYEARPGKDPNKAVLKRCNTACETRWSGDTSWKMKLVYRPLLCEKAAVAVAEIGQPVTPQDYRDLKSALIADLEDERNVSTLAAKLYRKVDGWDKGDTKNAYTRYCVDQVTDEEGED